MFSFSYTDEQLLLRKAISAFAQKHILPVVEECDEQERFPLEILPIMGREGFLGAGVPEEYEGSGGGMIEQCIITEELSKACSGIAVSVAADAFIIPAVIWMFGTEEQKWNYAVPVIKGVKVASIAITEPNAGSDVRSIQAAARLVNDEYVLDGQKIFITNGNICDFVIMLAYTDRSKGIAGTNLFIVDRDNPGFTARKLKNKDAVRSSETGELVFDNCRIPKSQLVGAGEGFKQVMKAFNGERVITAAMSLGTAQAAYEAALNYAKQRHQFGQPIIDFQAIQFRLAKIIINIEAARLLIYQAAAKRDAGEPYEVEASMAKAFTCEMAVRAACEALHCFGGYGIMKEYPASRYLRDTLGGPSYAGTTEIQYRIIANRLFR